MNYSRDKKGDSLLNTPFVSANSELSAGAHVDFVLNWFEELKRLVPTE